jgi:hypothetical protein
MLLRRFIFGDGRGMATTTSATTSVALLSIAAAWRLAFAAVSMIALIVTLQ